MNNSQFWDLLNEKSKKRRGDPTLEQIRHFATRDLTTGDVPGWVKAWLEHEDDPALKHLCPKDPEARCRIQEALRQRPAPEMSDEDFYALMEKMDESAARRQDIPRMRRIAALRGVALVEGRGSVPLWVKNELRYLDTYLTPCEAEQPVPIQWFRIAEDGYNGADEEELWWKGNIYAEDLPSERLRKKPVVRL